MRASIQMAASDFALPCPRTGSLESYSGYGPVPNVGVDVHLEVQSQRRRDWPEIVTERWLSHVFERPKLKITVSGRADIFVHGRPARIEEIKSTYDLESLRALLSLDRDHPYKRQLRTYGYMHHMQSGDEPDLALVLVCARTRRSVIFPVQLDTREYAQWLVRRLEEIEEDQRAFAKLHDRRKKEAPQIQFPFEESRSGQRELIDTVERNLGQHRQILIQAPTGLGKTIGILYPCLREAYARGNKLIYLTAKNTQHEVAEDAVKRLQASGCKVRSLTIHAKSKMCLKEEPQCSPHVCEFARDYYDKVARWQLKGKLAKRKNLSASSLKKLGQDFEVCPFELQMEAVGRADVVIGDYNYAFSPYNVRARLIENGFNSKSAPNLVIDEAHNLPARANDYFSARLETRQIEAYFGQASGLPPDQDSALLGVQIAFRGLVEIYRRPNPTRVSLNPSDFETLREKTDLLLSSYLASGIPLRPQDPVLRLCHTLLQFTERLPDMDENFFATWTPVPPGGILSLICCDASKWLSDCYESFTNVVAFSATLKPFDYYGGLLGVDPERAFMAEFQSPFPADRRKILIIPQISTKARDRAANYGRIRETLARIANLRRGNYFAFFPSFDFMHQVADRLSMPDFRIVTQTREMSRAAVESVLAQLRAGDSPMLVLAVQGGVFAEGVDYPGQMLIGAFIVGPALPSFDFEREQLREFYETKYGKGFDYAYTYPAMAKVVQSAGRVIRSHTDRGLIVLIDRRFLLENYANAMPGDWCPEGPDRLVSNRILHDVQHFWDGHGSE
jgi:DNA excision repair protein ERCC-2